MGDGGYAAPQRAVQIRERLNALERATPRDFLAMQLDDRGLFLNPWQKLLLSVLTPERIAEKSSRAELKRLMDGYRECHRLVLDLQDVGLVDRFAIQSLTAFEGNGVRLVNCPPYVRDSILRSVGSA